MQHLTNWKGFQLKYKTRNLVYSHISVFYTRYRIFETDLCKVLKLKMNNKIKSKLKWNKMFFFSRFKKIILFCFIKKIMFFNQWLAVFVMLFHCDELCSALIHSLKPLNKNKHLQNEQIQKTVLKQWLMTYHLRVIGMLIIWWSLRIRDKLMHRCGGQQWLTGGSRCSCRSLHLRCSNGHWKN